MIGNLKYEEFELIIKELESSIDNLDNIINIYKEKVDNGTLRMERFSNEMKNYVSYLKAQVDINKDADIAISRLKELNS